MDVLVQEYFLLCNFVVCQKQQQLEKKTKILDNKLIAKQKVLKKHFLQLHKILL